MAYTENNGVKIYFEVEGSGPPLMLMHGLSGSHKHWRKTGAVDRLAGSYRLILVDARGHGKSDKPRDPESYAPDLRAGDVGTVLDHLGIETAHYFGYSMGARIGYEVVVKKPDRLRSFIGGGIGIDAGPMRQLAENWANHTVEQMLERIQAAGLPMDEEQKADYLLNDGKAILACIEESLRVPYKELNTRLMNFQKPALIFVGTEDPRHDSGAELAALMPDCEFISIVDRDHIQAALDLDAFFPSVLDTLHRAEDAYSS